MPETPDARPRVSEQNAAGAAISHTPQAAISHKVAPLIRAPQRLHVGMGAGRPFFLQSALAAESSATCCSRPDMAPMLPHWTGGFNRRYRGSACCRFQSVAWTLFSLPSDSSYRICNRVAIDAHRFERMPMPRGPEHPREAISFSGCPSSLLLPERGSLRLPATNQGSSRCRPAGPSRSLQKWRR